MGIRRPLMCALLVQVEAFAQGMVDAVGEECDCFLAPKLETDELITLISESTASSLASVCVGGPPSELPIPPLACSPSSGGLYMLCMVGYHTDIYRPASTVATLQSIGQFWRHRLWDFVRIGPHACC